MNTASNLFNDTLSTLDTRWGVTGLKLFRLEALASNKIVLPFAEEAAQMELEAQFAGWYKAFLANETLSGQDISVRLGRNNEVEWLTTFVDGRPVQVETGKWQDNGNGRLTITLTGQPDQTYETPKIINLIVQNGRLTLAPNDASIFGVEQLDFYPLIGFLIYSIQTDTLLDILRNSEYQGIYDEPFELNNGRYEGEPFVEGGASRPTVELDGPVTAFGDIDGDGINEAVLVLVENSGGSGNFRYLAVMTFTGGTATNIATAFIGDRIQIKSIVIQDDKIILPVTTHGPNDGLCCPTLQTSLTYRLQGNQLIKEGDQ